MQKTPYYKRRISEELTLRLERNARYSQRAFAQSMGIASGALSEILNGKRVPSYKLAQKIAGRLGLTPDEKARFIESLAERQRERGLQRISPAFKRIKSRPIAQELSVDLFRIIGDWYHYAILMLTRVEGFQSRPAWIAKQLGITVAEVNLAIERLVNLEMLKVENGKLSVWREGISTTTDKHLTTPALRRHQAQVLEKALYSLQHHPLEQRSMTSMTMAIDPEKLPEARRRIERFTQELCTYLGSEKEIQVYELGICLYPLQTIQPTSDSKPEKLERRKI